MTPQEQLAQVLQGTINAVVEYPDARPILFFDPTTATYQSINANDPAACAGVFASAALIMVMPLNLADLRAWAASPDPLAAAAQLHHSTVTQDYDPWGHTLSYHLPPPPATETNAEAQ